jgi:DUF1365 family protein
VVYTYLDLAELDEVFSRRWFWSTRRPALVRFRRADYLGDRAISLDAAVRTHVERETGRRPIGPVRLLTHLRHFGFSFNPVSFYYCFDPTDQEVETIVAEITNTPWNERHAYVLPRTASVSPADHLRFRFGKVFHVSPFMPMHVQYDWLFGKPDDQLLVHMNALSRDCSVFDATLRLERRPITGRNLARVLTRYPLMPMKVIGSIYWQALRLFLKRTPFYCHPSRTEHHMEAVKTQ